jgi:hypothetical protein
MSKASGSAGKYTYVPAYPEGDPRYLHSAARANVSTGELMARWHGITETYLNRYKGEHGRAGSASSGLVAQGATQDVLARLLFSAYIRYCLAQKKHGIAAAFAPRTENEYSQTAYTEPVVGWFTTTERLVKARGGLGIKEEREINAIVGEYPDEAAEYGLVQGGDNAGPAWNEDTAKAKVAAEEAALPDASKPSATPAQKIAAGAAGDSKGNVGAFAGGRRRKARKTRKSKAKGKSRKGKSRKGKSKSRKSKGTRRH